MQSIRAEVTFVPVDGYIDFNCDARIVKKGSECKTTKPGVITWIRHISDAGGLKVGDSVAVCTKAHECEVHKKVDSRSQRPRKSFEQMADTRIANLRQHYPQTVRAALIRAVIESNQKEGRKLSPSDKIKIRQLDRNKIMRSVMVDIGALSPARRDNHNIAIAATYQPGY